MGILLIGVSIGVIVACLFKLKLEDFFNTVVTFFVIAAILTATLPIGKWTGEYEVVSTNVITKVNFDATDESFFVWKDKNGNSICVIVDVTILETGVTQQTFNVYTLSSDNIKYTQTANVEEPILVIRKEKWTDTIWSSRAKSSEKEHYEILIPAEESDANTLIEE